MRAAGINPTLLPPPMTGGPVLTGLQNVAFAHERTGYGNLDLRVLLDSLRQADGYLREQEKAAQRHRRRPLYWPDRIVRALLAFPAYIISVLFGIPQHRIEASAFAPFLRILAVAADVLGIYLAGRVVKWW